MTETTKQKIYLLYDCDEWETYASINVNQPIAIAFKNPRNQGVSRFQSGEELVNSVGK